MRKSCVLIALMFLAWVPVFAQELPPEVVRYADMVLHNGTILTVDREDENFSVHQAVALRDGLIMASGDNNRILRMAGPNTQRIDLEGRTVMPGVIDTHSHPENYAQRHFQNDFRRKLNALDLYKTGRISMMDFNDLEVALGKVRNIAEGVKPGQWIIFSVGHEIEPGHPDNAKALKAEFDKIAPDNPLVFHQSTTHAVVNSKTLELLDKHYKDMPGIYKDADGKPTGYLFGGARGALDELLPKVPPDIYLSAYRKELEEWAAMGVTTIATRLKGEHITIYTLLDRQGDMPIRIAYMHQLGWWNPMPERDLYKLGNLEGHGTDMIWNTGITPAPPDDAADSSGAVCSEAPKLQHIVTDRVARLVTTGDQKTLVSKDIYPDDGLCRWLRPGGEVSRETVLAANQIGYRIAGVHTYGDKGIGTMLDTYEEATLDRPIEDRRFAIDHTMMVSPEIIERSAKLNIIWSAQPQMAESPRSDLTQMMYGETIINNWLQPLKSIIDAGMKVTYGADVHGERGKPMFGMEYMVARKNHRGIVYAPQEKVDRKTALIMMTRWGAEYVEREHELGSIEPGKIADLIVLDKNPLDESIPEDNISDINVLMTLVGGDVRFTQEDFAKAKGLPTVGYRGGFTMEY